MRPDPTLRIGVDVGGTFTDFLVVDEAGNAEIHKTSTTPGDPSIGFFRGLQKAADQRDIEFIAKDYCLLTGLVAGAWMWLRIAQAGADDDRDDLFRHGNCARFYAEYLMPEMHTLAHRVSTGFAKTEE